MDIDIYQNPKTLDLSELCDIDHWRAGEYMIRFFLWARRFCEVGKVKYTAKEISKYLELPLTVAEGFWTVGIIEEDGWIGSWNEWGGSEIVERARKNPDKYRLFLEKFQEIPGCSRKFRTEERRGEEKREEKKDLNLPPSGGLPDLERPIWIKAWHEGFLKAHGRAPDIAAGLRAMDKRRKAIHGNLDEWCQRIENCFGNPFTKNFTLLEFAGVKWDKCASPFEGGNRGRGTDKNNSGKDGDGTCAEPERVPKSAI